MAHDDTLTASISLSWDSPRSRHTDFFEDSRTRSEFAAEGVPEQSPRYFEILSLVEAG
jgi:hypothetical protein